MSSNKPPVSSKADYVRSAKQTRRHTCHWPGCRRQVPPAMSAIDLMRGNFFRVSLLRETCARLVAEFDRLRAIEERHSQNEHDWTEEHGAGVPVLEEWRAARRGKWQCGECGIYNYSRDLSTACDGCGEVGDKAKSHGSSEQPEKGGG